MPEIPEMETYRLLLNKSITGKKITQVQVQRPKTINLPENAFIDKIQEQLIKEVNRRAKYLILQLQDGNFLLAHMMLDGRIQLTSDAEDIKAQVTFKLDDGTNVNFTHMGLGYLHYHTPDQLNQELQDLGTEPLSKEFTWDRFQKLLKGRRGAIKPMLMDQKIIAGIGNAYSNEILFAARLLPERKVPTIKDEERQLLFKVTPQVLNKAIDAGGYIETPLATWDNKSGGMLDKFMVYDREGQPCQVCGNLIESKEVGGRNAFFCTVCQH